MTSWVATNRPKAYTLPSSTRGDLPCVPLKDTRVLNWKHKISEPCQLTGEQTSFYGHWSEGAPLHWGLAVPIPTGKIKRKISYSGTSNVCAFKCLPQEGPLEGG